MTKRITLIDESTAQPIGEVGTDLLRAELRQESDPSTLMLKGDSPLVTYLMDCKRKPLVMSVELCAKCGDTQQFRVQDSSMHYDHGAWTSHVELVRSDPL